MFDFYPKFSADQTINIHMGYYSKNSIMKNRSGV